MSGAREVTQWERAAAPPPLPDGEVQVWRVSLHASAAEVARLRGRLTADERARADDFRFDLHRNRYTVGRARLRELLGGYLGQAPEAVALRYGPHGKPALVAPALCFNLSNAEDVALLAVGHSELGVDVERLARQMDFPGVARVCFSAREREELSALGPEQLPEAFFAGWTRKEALLKAWGSGLAFPLKDFEVTLDPTAPPFLKHLKGDPDAPSRWRLYDLFPQEGFRGALATDTPVQVRTLSLEVEGSRP